VLLIEYADSVFSMDDPKTYYHQLLNVTTSNTRGGVGCAADYFRDQSDGMFNLQFDVYGPVKVSQSARVTSKKNYGKDAIKEAIQKSVDSLHIDYSPYDWNHDGEVEQVVLVASGYCGNVGGPDFYQFIWPNTSWLNHITVGDGLYVSQCSISAERFGNDIPCGIGTICHEYAHCLGLPDIYPVGGGNDLPYSMVDEWDLMDGGNFTAWGWCPPNFTALEKSLLGWTKIEEIKAPCQITNLKPVADGGLAYKIPKQGENDYYLLENRQQSGWDIGVPGKGLTVYHVEYDAENWRLNRVNVSGRYSFEMIHASDMDYESWMAYAQANHLSQYVSPNDMNSCLLSTSPYPLVTDTLVVRHCDETPMLLSNIQMTDAGLISFDVEQGTGIDAIDHSSTSEQLIDNGWYELQGRKLTTKPTQKGLYIHHKQKIVIW
jgi:M6 family metalloprotease-like protein